MRIPAASWLRGAIGLGIVYCNLAVVAGPYGGRYAPPLPPELREAFLIFGVFSWYETSNSELTIWGMPEGSEHWIAIAASDYFPHDRAERSTRMWAARHYRLLDRESHGAVWESLGRKILERYNREHPRAPMRKLAFQLVTWPRSSEGFYAMLEPDSPRQYWVIAETSARSPRDPS